jgi:hypothetical protein
MRKVLLLLVLASLVVVGFRNFMRLSGQPTRLDDLEKSILPLVGKYPHQNQIAYYSNTYDDGQYFNAQLLLTPKVLTKFGKGDTALFVYNLASRDTLFHPKRLDYHVVDSMRSGQFQSYLLIRKK